MIQVHFGLNQPFCSAHTPTREVNGSPTFVNGQWIMLVSGKATLASTNTVALVEQAFEPNNKNTAGVLTTIDGMYEASTDQYNTSASPAIVDGSLLRIVTGVLDSCAANGSQDIYAVARAIGAPANGLLRYKRIHANG